MEITIRGKSFPGDFYDADFIENYERQCIELSKATARVQGTKYPSTADGYRAMNRIVEEFFDGVLGAGSADQIFEDAKGNVRVHLEAVEELNGQAAAQKKGMNDLANRYTQKQAARAQAAEPQSATVVPFNPNRQNGHGKKKRRR